MNHLNKPMRARIRAYRASGRMFGQTFHTGTNAPETNRALTCAMLEVSRWFAERNRRASPRYARECVRQSIATLRQLRAQAFGA